MVTRAAAALLLLLAGAGAAAGAEPAPARVVSVNLCTDQLAMLIAAPGQLVSVSWLAGDPAVSLMPGKAHEIGINRGGAEEVYLLAPDLVLAGTYSTGPTSAMLRRLGIRVETIPPAMSVGDIRRNITRMGDLLGQPGRAARLLAGFDADLAAIRPGAARLAASYAANGFTAGAGSLSGDIMRRAGLVLLSAPAGEDSRAMALEQLVMASPEMIVTGSRYRTPSRAEAVLDHPAFAAIPATRRSVADRDWICGLPAVSGIVARLAE